MGMSIEALNRVETLLLNGIDNSIYSCYTCLVLRHGNVVFENAAGYLNVDRAERAYIDTIFDCASISKTVTATMLLQCVEEGILHLDQEVRYFFPEAADFPIGTVSLKKLATHTSGLPPWRSVKEAPNPLEAVLNAPIEAEPGTRYAYSDLGYIMLGLILERLLGDSLDMLAYSRIFSLLQMESTGYCPPVEWHSRLAATTAPLGVVHDPNARAMGGIAGHAGLFSTATDLARYCIAIMPPKGKKDEWNLLTPLARRLAHNRQTDPPLNAHTIGWFAYPNGFLPKGDLFSSHTFGHTGFTGTMVMIEPELDIITVLLTNRVIYENENDGVASIRQRKLIANLIGAAVQD